MLCRNLARVGDTGVAESLAQPQPALALHGLTDRQGNEECARPSQRHGIVTLGSSLVTNSAPEDGPAFHEVLQTVGFLLEGKEELCLQRCAVMLHLLGIHLVTGGSR